MTLALSLDLRTQGSGNSPPTIDALIAALSGSLKSSAYQPSNLGTLWQDTGATTAVTSGDPVRRMNDQTGNGQNLIAPGDAARPTATDGLTLDGVDDTMSAILNGGSGSSDMTIVLVTKILSGGKAAGGLVSFNGNTAYAGLYQDGNGNAVNLGVAPTITIDDVAFSGNRNALHDAVSDDTAHVVVISGLDLSARSNFGISSVTFTGFDVDGVLFPAAVIDNTTVSNAATALAAAKAHALSEIGSLAL